MCMKLLVGRSKLSVSAAVIFKTVAAAKRNIVAVKRKERRSRFMQLSLLELLSESKQELPSALELARCDAPRLCRRFAAILDGVFEGGFRARPNLCKVCAK